MRMDLIILRELSMYFLKMQLYNDVNQFVVALVLYNYTVTNWTVFHFSNSPFGGKSVLIYFK